MKKQALISVIIPVYNVEDYVKNCLDSVINQTYKNIEILTIDDGSTDSSKKICEEYSKKDKRIKVFHKDNGGLSSARNYGIDNAKGEYFIFVDSDDTIENDCVEKLYNLIVKNKVKMSIGAYSIICSNKTIDIGKKFKSCIMDTKTCLANMYQENGFTVSACAKMYHKSLFNNIRYPEGRLYEDNGTTYKIVMLCNKISYTNKSIYNYFIRKGSITNKKFSIKKMDYIYLTDEACNKILDKYPELLLECEYRKAVARLSVLRQMYASKLTNDEIKERDILVNYFMDNYKSLMNNRCASKRMKISLKMLKFSKLLFKLGVCMYGKLK